MDATTFKTLIYNMAGYNIHNITVDDTVWENYILPKATRKYVEKHYDGAKPSVYQLDLTSGVLDYTLPNTISMVSGVYLLGGSGVVSPEISPRKLMYEQNMHGDSYEDLMSYSYFSGYLEQQQITYGTYYLFSYNRQTRNFHIQNDEDKTEMYLECYTDESINNIDVIREDDIFQDLCLALLLQCWARTMNKYDLVLIGGRQLNWRDIKEDGKNLWDETIQLIENEYSEPVEFDIG